MFRHHVLITKVLYELASILSTVHCTQKSVVFRGELPHNIRSSSSGSCFDAETKAGDQSLLAVKAAVIRNRRRPTELWITAASPLCPKASQTDHPPHTRELYSRKIEDQMRVTGAKKNHFSVH